MSSRTVFCLVCSANHQLVYVVAANFDTHMGYYCPKKKGRLTHVPKVEGLKLPIVQSKQWHKARQNERQQELL
jgi:hypothetical protein